MLALLGLGAFSCKEDTADEGELVFLTSMEDQVLVLVNEHRATLGLTALEDNSVVKNQARIHSRNMADGSVSFGHNGFEARVEVITGSVEGVQGAGENVALGPTTAAEAVETWLKSDGHRANIEGDYTLSGIGIVEDDASNLLFTHIFIKLN